MNIRSAMPLDLDTVLAADATAQHDFPRRRLLERCIRENTCWVVEADGRIRGFLVLDYSFYGNGFVSLLVVHEDARRLGMGRALLQHAATICETPKLFTSTNESNAAMRALLADAGFVASGIIHDLDPGDPELVFVRRRSETIA